MNIRPSSQLSPNSRCADQLRREWLVNKMLLTIPNAEYDGAERQMLALAIGLQNRGYSVHICNLEGCGPFIENVRKTSIPYTVINRTRRLDIARLRSYHRFVNRQHFDVIISFTSLANNMTRLVKLLSPGLKSLLIAGERGRDLSQKTFYTLIDSMLARFSDIIICNAITQKQALAMLENIPLEKIGVIYNGIDLNRVIQKKDYTIKDTLRLITIGRLETQKNHQMLLRVLRVLRLRIDRPVHLQIVGAGSLQSELKATARHLGIINDVEFLGLREDVPNLLNQADIFLLSSLFEGMPNVLLEAMATGLPTVSTAVDGALEISEDGKVGFLVRPDDINAMAEKIILLYQNLRLRKSIGTAGRETVVERYGMEQMIESYERLFLYAVKKSNK